MVCKPALWQPASPGLGLREASGLWNEFYNLGKEATLGLLRPYAHGELGVGWEHTWHRGRGPRAVGRTSPLPGTAADISCAGRDVAPGPGPPASLRFLLILLLGSLLWGLYWFNLLCQQRRTLSPSSLPKAMQWCSDKAGKRIQISLKHKLCQCAMTKCVPTFYDRI